MRVRAVITIALGAFLVACGAAPANGGGGEGQASALKVDLPSNSGATLDTIHLGRVREGEVVKSSFAIRNISQSPLVIVDVRVACGCAKAQYDVKPIMAGEERRVDFTFNSQGRLGMQIKYFDVVDAQNRSCKVFFDAQVVQ